MDRKKAELGFGLMRLPRKGGGIDIEQTKAMVDMFMEAGFTYFDTAWAYEGSEEAIRQALVERYPRDSYRLATKNAAWIDCNSSEDARRQLETSLRRTGAGYFDYYLLHNIGQGRTRYFDDYGMWDWALRKKEDGIFRHVGFSFHSTAEELDEVLREHPEMEFVQLQINYADWDNAQVRSGECYEVARKHGKPIIVMEPVKGGMLANPPREVAELFRQADPEASVPSWAVRFAADLDGVKTVLSGMSSVEQMADNISYMKDFDGLTERQRQTVYQARDIINGYPLIPCTKCDYCAKVCPTDIGISGTFTALNYMTLYGNADYARGQENWLVTGQGRKRADECVKCGRCEEACPQHISIREHLEEAVKLFDMEKKEDGHE